MKTQPRWIAATLREADACKTRMPWERGLRRAATIARRQAPPSRPEPHLAPQTEPQTAPHKVGRRANA